MKISQDRPVTGMGGGGGGGGGLETLETNKNLPFHLEGILDIKTELDFASVC